MNDAIWSPSRDTIRRWKELPTPPSERKLRLVACAVCRQYLRRYGITEARLLRALATAERLADGLSGPWEVGYAWGELQEFKESLVGHEKFEEAAVARLVQRALEEGACPPADSWEVLEELFGNPFRPVTADPAWLAWEGGAVRRLAQALYDERRFEDLPMLADALEAAGCRDAPLLDHCLGPAAHCRGCWALDLILGKD
jgi:hypothetical protein